MYKYCYSNEGAIYVKGLWKKYTVFYFFAGQGVIPKGQDSASLPAWVAKSESSCPLMELAIQYHLFIDYDTFDTCMTDIYSAVFFFLFLFVYCSCKSLYT